MLQPQRSDGALSARFLRSHICERDAHRSLSADKTDAKILVPPSATRDDLLEGLELVVTPARGHYVLVEDDDSTARGGGRQRDAIVSKRVRKSYDLLVRALYPATILSCSASKICRVELYKSQSTFMKRTGPAASLRKPGSVWSKVPT